MRHDTGITARRVTDEADRRRIIEVLAATYQEEKRWVSDPAEQIPPDHLARDDIAWFVVTLAGRPAGALRVLFDPSYAEYAAYGLTLLDPTLRVEEFLQRGRIAEVGRFAVKPEHRGQFMIAVALIRAATQETVARGCTHLVTDVFEDDPHTPYGFHTRVLGFRPVATHDVGELHCRSRRITLVLDLDAAYGRLNTRRNWLFRYLTGGWGASLHARFASGPASGGRSTAVERRANHPDELLEVPAA
jgi:GNAT superfamily N-acetyltransferase